MTSTLVTNNYAVTTESYHQRQSKAEWKKAWYAYATLYTFYYTDYFRNNEDLYEHIFHISLGFMFEFIQDPGLNQKSLTEYKGQIAAIQGSTGKLLDICVECLY